MDAARTIYHHCRLFDGVSEALADGLAIVVSGERIEAVDAESEVLAGFTGYERVDLGGLTVLPGLIDAHVHVSVPLMTDYGSRQARADVERQRELNLRSCLKYGITSVRDMGAFPDSLRVWTDRIAKGEAVGPRVFTAGSVITSRNGPPERAPHLRFPLTRMFGGQLAERVSTPKEVAQIARRNLDHGASFLKTQYEEDSMFFAGRLATLSDVCFDAVRDVASERGVKVAMHHTEAAGFRKGIEHGSDTLEHCALDPLDQRDIDRFVARGMAIVPTLRANRGYLDVDETLAWLTGEGREDYAAEPLAQIGSAWAALGHTPYPPAGRGVYLDVEKSGRGFATTVANVALIRQAGGTIGVGTECFGSHLNLPGFLFKELELLTDAGLSNAETLRAVTSVNARIVGAEADLGGVTPGRCADLAIVDGDPLADIGAVRNVRLVVMGGVPYREGRPMRPGDAASLRPQLVGGMRSER